jgi:hypothetical protein
MIGEGDGLIGLEGPNVERRHCICSHTSGGTTTPELDELLVVVLGCFGVCNMLVGVGWFWFGEKLLGFWCEVSGMSAGDEGCRV